MERSPQDEDLVIAMPSLAELSSVLSPMQTLALEGAIESQSRSYQESVRQYGYEDAPSQFVAFTIPLDSHLPLPEAHGSIVHMHDKQKAAITLAHHAAMETKVGTKKLTAVVTALVVGIGSKDTAAPLASLNETAIMAM